MNLSPKALQNIVILTAVIFIALIAFLSIEVARETPNPIYTDVDFKGKADIISAYGTLIGGILSFLSILFVLFNVYEVRHQLRQEKMDKAKEEFNASLNRLKLILLTMDSTYDAIITQGENFERYYKDEKENPAMPSAIGRVVIKNLDRLSDLEMEKFFLSLQTIDSNRDWSEILRDFFKYNDFYKDSIQKIFETIYQHIKQKSESISVVSAKLEQFQEVVESFLMSSNRPTYIEGNFKSGWDKTIQNFYTNFKKYVQESYEVDFKVIMEHLDKFIFNCQPIFRDEPLPTDEIAEIFSKAVFIRNRIDIIQKDSLEMAEMIEFQYIKYYDVKSSKLNKYDSIRAMLRSIIDEVNFKEKG